MKRLIASDGYARAKTLLGAVYVVFGLVVVGESAVRVQSAGFKVIPLAAFGLAVAGLGIVRIRGYVMRSRP